MNLRIIIAVSLVMLFVPSVVFAAGAPRCGSMERSMVSDVYSLADDVRRYHDARGDIRGFCDALQRMKEWEKKVLTRDERHSSAFKKERDRLNARASEALKRVKPPLKILHVYLRVKTHNARDEAIRIARLRGARKDAQSAQGGLGHAQDQVLKFMSDYNRKRATQNSSN